MKWASPLLAALLVFLPPCAHADRPVPLPRDAKVGELKGYEYPQVRIDGKAYTLAPGAIFFDTYNRTILPVYLPPSATVLYRIDSQGQLSKLWLLTPEEGAEAHKAQK